MSSKIIGTIALHLAWFPILFVAWLAIAGHSASPVPDNWPALARTLDVIELSALTSLYLLVLAPAAAYAASRGSRWALPYPILLALNCSATIVLCLIGLTQASK